MPPDFPIRPDLSKLRSQLIEHESLVPYAYQDHLGYWTIGIGHLIDKRKGGRLSPAAINFIFEEDVQQRVAALDSHLPWWRRLTEVRQRVLIEMAFQLGMEGLLKFRHTLGEMRTGSYVGAFDGMLASRWAIQTPTRAMRLALMMRDDRDVSWSEAEREVNARA